MVDHNGQVQYGGKESGEPWTRAVCSMSDGDIAIIVNGVDVARYPREEVEVNLVSGMYQITGGEGDLYFLPDDMERFRIDWEGPADAGERIALAAQQPSPATGLAPGLRSKVAAGVLGIVLGTFGAHKFYLGETGMGVLYLVFFWTGIPTIVGLIEGIIYLTMTDEAFAQKYG